MTSTLSNEDKIRLLLTTINDITPNKKEYEASFMKLLTRLNEFYDTNKVDIVMYFTKVITLIPLKSKVYANALYEYNKTEIINEILTKLTSEIKSTNNKFIILRTLRFFMECVNFGVINPEFYYEFLGEGIKGGNYKLLNLIIGCVISMYNPKEENNSLNKTVAMIYDSNLFKENKLWNSIYKFIALNSEKKSSVFFNLPTISPSKNEEKAENFGAKEFSGVLSPFKSFAAVDFFKASEGGKSKRTQKMGLEMNLIWDSEVKFEDLQTQVIFMDVLEAFKDNCGLMENYLFNLDKFYNISNENNEINRTIQKNLPISIFILLLDISNSKENFSVLLLNICKLLKQNSCCDILQYTTSDKKENYFIDFVEKNICDVNFISSLSPFQLLNLSKILITVAINFPKEKSKILSVNLSQSKALKSSFFIKSLKDKIFEFENKSSSKYSVDDSEKNDFYSVDPIVPTGLKMCEDYTLFTSSVDAKVPLSDFVKDLLNKEPKDLLYNLICSILCARNHSLFSIDYLLNFYQKDIKAIIIDDVKYQKDQIIIQTIFDMYKNCPVYYKYILDKLLDLEIVNHLNVIQYIMKHFLNEEKKENIGNYSFYEILVNTVENSEHLFIKLKSELSSYLSLMSSSEEEEKTKEIRGKIDQISAKIKDFEEIKVKLKEITVNLIRNLCEKLSKNKENEEYMLFVDGMLNDLEVIFNE